MNKVFLDGVIKEVSDYKTFQKNDKSFRYRQVVFELGDELIVANYWANDALPPIGSDVKFKIKISSERNNKDPEIFFHKINLVSVYECDRLDKKV